MNSWHIFRGDTNTPHDGINSLPDPPPWRRFDDRAERNRQRGATYQVNQEERLAINLALRLRRPLLITGSPGLGKSSLAYAIAHELNLGDVLEWRITTRSTLQEGLYSYDAIGRLRQANLDALLTQGKTEKLQQATENIGDYMRLGPLGTALLRGERPRVLLVDEIDKSDIDLPNDLLHIFEEGSFEIAELVRHQVADVPVRTWDAAGTTWISKGRVECSSQSFPIVIFTSNGERSFPAAFNRRCIRIRIQPPPAQVLHTIVKAHFASFHTPLPEAELEALVERFVAARGEGDLATDQLLNMLFMVTGHTVPDAEERKRMEQILLQKLKDE